MNYLLQYLIIKNTFKTANYTILGDTNQTINPYYQYNSLEELKKAKEEHFTLNEKNNALKKDHEGLKNDIELKNKEKEELDKQKKEYETLNMKLVHENENLNGLNKLKEELSNKYNEILRNEDQMNL